MSYILDALRKAERDHQVSRVPTLATAHGGSDRRRPAWLWPAACGVLAFGVVATYMLQWAPARPHPPEPVAQVVSPSTTSAVVPSAPYPAAPGAPVVPVVPERSRAPAGAGPPIADPAAARAPGTQTLAPPSAVPSSPAARPAPEVRSKPGRMSPAAPPAGKPMAAAATRPASSPPLDREAVRASPPAEEAVAPPAAAIAAPPSDGASARVAPPATVQGSTRLSLDVLVYSDVPAERLVFINGRKYVEGQAVGDGAIVEQITPDGAVLRQDGKPIVLRPKLNPYARPGSP